MGNNISFRTEFGLIVVGAIIVTASLLWKDLFTEIGEKLFPKHQGLGGRAFYTLMITILLIMFAVFLKDIWNIKNVSEPPIKPDPSQAYYVAGAPKSDPNHYVAAAGG